MEGVIILTFHGYEPDSKQVLKSLVNRLILQLFKFFRISLLIISIDDALPDFSDLMVELTSVSNIGSFKIWGLGEEILISSAMLIRDCLVSVLIVEWLSEYNLLKNDSKLSMSWQSKSILSVFWLFKLSPIDNFSVFNVLV